MMMIRSIFWSRPASHWICHPHKWLFSSAIPINGYFHHQNRLFRIRARIRNNIPYVSVGCNYLSITILPRWLTPHGLALFHRSSAWSVRGIAGYGTQMCDKNIFTTPLWEWLHPIYIVWMKLLNRLQLCPKMMWLYLIFLFFLFSGKKSSTAAVTWVIQLRDILVKCVF